ncbi:MAG: hypothetical protein GX442_24565 [Candidatus Riflebacteria bacterium]|nr:hypothetical protein [Candidatus Riflebacteria bacterium]
MTRIQPSFRVPIVRFPFPFPYPPVRRPGGPQPFRWAIALLLAAVLTAAPCPAQVATVSVCGAEEVSALDACLPLAEEALVEGAIPGLPEACAEGRPATICEPAAEREPALDPGVPRLPIPDRQAGCPSDDGFADVIADGGSPVSWHTIQYRLPPGETSRTWTVRIDLPEADLQAGRVFIRRHLATTDSLEAVREELTRTSYTVTLSLSRGFFATGKGNLHLQLEKGTPVPVERLPPPANLRIEEGGTHEPFLIAWDGEGDWLAATVYKRALGTPVWQRILGYSGVMPTIDPAPVTIGGHYLLVASQCGREARPSKPAYLAFRVEARSEWCQTCKGTGWLGQAPAGWPHPGRAHVGPSPLPQEAACSQAVGGFGPGPGPEVSRESGIGTTFAADEGDAGQTRPAGSLRHGRRRIPLVLVGAGSSRPSGSSPHPTPAANPGKAPLAKPGKPPLARSRSDGEPYSELCPYCRGLGTRMYPYAVTEPLMPSMGD